MKKCSELKFGFIDSQRYLQDPDDPLAEFFRKSFYKSIHLERAVDPDVYFLLGEEGTGKTAYAVYASLFMKDEYHADCEFFDKDDFTRFIEVAASLSIGRAQYSTMWVFIFLILFIQKLDMRFSLSKNNEIGHIIEAIKTINLGGYAKTISRCIESTSKVSSLFNLFIEVSDTRVPKHVLDGATPAFKMNRLTDICVEASAKLPAELQFAMFIDGLDVRPEEVNYPDYW